MSAQTRNAIARLLFVWIVGLAGLHLQAPKHIQSALRSDR